MSHDRLIRVLVGRFDVGSIDSVETDQERKVWITSLVVESMNRRVDHWSNRIVMFVHIPHDFDRRIDPNPSLQTEIQP